MNRSVKGTRNAVEETPEQKLINEVIASFEDRAAEEHELLLQSNRELGYLRTLKPGQLPVIDGRLVPNEPGGIVWDAAKRASLEAKRAKTRQKASDNEEEQDSLSEERRQANKQWVQDIRTGAIQPNTDQRRTNECVWCLGPVEPVQHDRCQCWQCSKPANHRVTKEKYDALIEKGLGFPVPAKACTCAPSKGLPIRCADCRFRGSLNLFPKKLGKITVDAGHNVWIPGADPGEGGSLTLAPGRECLCQICVDSREHMASPGTGRCASCVKSEEWRRTQYMTGLHSSVNPYKKEQLQTDQDVVDFIASDHKFVHHENTRRAMDDRIVREQVQKANDEFLGCDRVLVQILSETESAEIFDNLTPTERALKYAGAREQQQIAQGTAWRENNREIALAAAMDNHQSSNPKVQYPWEKR